MTKRYRLEGIANPCQLGKGGALLKDASGIVQLRNSADSAYARVQGADGVVDDDLVTIRQLNLSAATTEPITSAPIAGADPVTLVMGERVYLSDTGGGPAMSATLPTITSGDAGDGRRCSLILPFGNPNRDLDIIAASGQGIFDPSGFLSVSTLTFPSGTFSNYTVLDLEAVFGAVTPVSLPGTVTPPLSPDTWPGPGTNPGVISVTINGTGGTLPAMIDLQVDLDAGVGTVSTTVTSALQPGGPGTAWTIVTDIAPSSLPPFPTLFDLEISDISGGPPVMFAVLLGAFGSNTPASPSQPSPITDLWVIESNAFASTPAGAGRLDEVLALGPNTDGNNEYLMLEDEMVWTDEAAPLADPTVPPPSTSSFHKKASRSGFITAGSGYIDIGSAIHTFTGPAASGLGNTIWMRWTGQFKAIGPSGPVGIAILEQVWSYDTNVWSLVETLVSSASAGSFRFNGTGASIFVQGLRDATFQFGTRGVVEWSWIDGFTPS